MESVEYFIIVCLMFVLLTNSKKNTGFDNLEKCHSQFHSCSAAHKNMFCLCDSLCEYYDDCCFDAGNTTKQISKRDNNQLGFVNRTSCEAVSYGSMLQLNQHKGAFMVSSCPEFLNIEIEAKRKCENKLEQLANIDIMDNVPVTDIYTNVSFKNKHCARCNQVKNWVPWFLEIHCGFKSFLYNRYLATISLAESVRLGINDEDCGHRFVPPKFAEARQCFHHFKYDLWNTLSHYTRTTCRNRVLAPVQYNSGVYRSIHCFLDAISLNYSNVASGVMCFLNRRYDQIHGRLKLLTITSVIDISSLIKRDSNTTRCGETGIFLSDKVMCQRLYCPINMEPNGGKCRNVLSSTDGKILDLLFEVNGDINWENAYAPTLLYSYMLRETLALLKTCIIFSGSENPKEAVTVFQGKHLISDKTCAMVILRYPLKKKIDKDCSAEYEKQLVMSFAVHYSRNHLAGIIVSHVNDVTNLSCRTNVTLNNPVYIKEQHWSGNRLPCSAVKVDILNSSTHHVDRTAFNTTSEGDMYFDLNGTIIDVSDVVYFNDGIYLCIKTYRSKYLIVNQENSVHYRTIIITVCTCVSMLGLLYCIVQYSVVPFMKTGKSDLIFMLLIFLLLAQTCFLVMLYVGHVQQFCEWFGMIHQVAWLGSFVFMFLCSFRLHEEVKTVKSSKSENTLSTVRYICVGLSVIVVIVSATQITNIYLFPSDNWYGGRVCLILHSFALLIAFMIPISFLVYWNMIVFAFIKYDIFNINPISTISNTINVKLIVFMEILTLLGCIWILGLVALIDESDVLFKIFENVISFQGMVITIIFAFNHRHLKKHSTHDGENTA